MRLLALALLSFFTGVAAEDSPLQFPLQQVNRTVVSGETRCLPFFVTTTFGGGMAEQIVFSYKALDGSTKRDTVPKARALVKVGGEKATYEKTEVNGRDGALFRLSQAEYEKARACLPEADPMP